MIRAAFRSRHPVALATALLVVLLGGWGAWRWTKQRLPGIMRARISAVLDRDVTVTSVDPWFTSLTVQGIRIARTREASSGTQVSASQLIIRFWLPSLIRHFKNPARAIRRVELVDPYIELPMEPLTAALDRPAARRRDSREAASMPALAAIPRTYFLVRNGTVVVTRRSRPVAEVKRLGAELDLRELPSIRGNLRLVIAPESEVSLSGRVNLSLRDFEGQMALDHLDLGQLSDLLRLADPRMPARLGGRLKADLEVVGGFMTVDEVVSNTTGRGSLEWEDGSLALRGRELIAGASASGSLDGREIALESLSARVLAGQMDAAGHLGNLGYGRLALKGRLAGVPVQALRALSPGLPENLAGTFDFEFSASGTGHAPIFSGRLTAPTLGVPGMMASGVRAEAVYAISEVRLTALSATLWDGYFGGAGAVTGLVAGEPHLDFTLHGTGITVARTPLGDRFAGRASLDASLTGPIGQFSGDLSLAVAGLTGHALATGDLAAKARFDRGRISVDANTLTHGVGVHGTIVLGPDPHIEGGEADVQEVLPVIFAVIGMKPPEGFTGRVRGKVMIEGPLRSPTLAVEAVGSAIRWGDITIADVIRVPRFTFSGAGMEVPDATPIELEWGPERTTVAVSGRVPLAAFAARGKEPLHLHVETHKARLDFLKRLGFVKDADGTFDLAGDIGGTTSVPVWTSLALAGEGRKLVLKEKFFEKDLDYWKADVVMKDSEGEIKTLEFGVDKQRQVLSGKFGMNGWIPSSADLVTETVAASRKAKDLKGLPIELEDIADVRAKLFAHLVKQPDEEDATLTGPDPEKGAELVLANGTIMYTGGARGSGTKAAKGAGAAPLPPSPLGKWFAEHFSYRGTVAFERNVAYAPTSFLTRGATKAVKSLFGDKDSFKKFLNSYKSRSGVTQGLTEEMLAFDVKIKDGSSIVAEIHPHQEPKVYGLLDLEPGGKVTFAYSIAFRLVDEPGVFQRIEFQPGDRLEAQLTLTAETILYDKMFTTDQGPATVDELAVRLKLAPPGPNDPPQEGFLKYKFDIVSEPETITGEVEIPEDKTVTTPAAGTDTPAPETVARTRPVTFKPDKSGLMTALFGFDKLASASTAQAGTDKSGEAIANLKSTATTSFFNAILSPFRKLLGLDVLSVRKSDAASHKTRVPAATTPGGPASPGLVASTLEENEITVGKSITRNLFANMHAIMLDSTPIAARGTGDLATQPSSSVGITTELEYRRSF